MRAVRATKASSVVLERIRTPKPGRGMALIKTLRAGICGSDLHALRQLQSGITNAETLLGHEVCGVVTEVGEGVEGVAVGDRVVVEPLARCGRCRNCRAGRYNVCESGAFILGVYADRPGALADYFEAPAYCLVPVLEGLQNSQAALVEPLAVGVHGLRMAEPGLAPSVAVIGAGTIGLCAVAAAVAYAAKEVIVLGRHPQQLEVARRLGATRVIAARDGLSGDELREELGVAPPDVVIEAVGGAAGTVDLALGLVRKGGTISIVGGYWQNDRVDVNALLLKEVRITGSNCYAAPDGTSDFEEAMRILAANPSIAATLVTHEYSLDDAEEAFATAFDKRTGSIKVMVAP